MAATTIVTVSVQLFLAAARRYGIKVKHTTPGHPHTNRKVERLNHELISTVEKGFQRKTATEMKIGTYAFDRLFSHFRHISIDAGTRHLLSTAWSRTRPTYDLPTDTTYPLRIECVEATEHHRNDVKNLTKYRTEAAKKYHVAIRRLASKRDDTSFMTPLRIRRH
jgi:hypothetical protein